MKLNTYSLTVLIAEALLSRIFAKLAHVCNLLLVCACAHTTLVQQKCSSCAPGTLLS